MTRKDLINSSDYFVDKVVKIKDTNYDRRRVVTKSMKRRMIQMYESGKSINSIANHFNVSYDSVKRAVNPMYNESEKARKKNLARTNKYSAEYDPNRLRNRANYKRQLIMEKKNVVFS